MKKLVLIVFVAALGALAWAQAQDEGLPKVAPADAQALEKLNQAGAVALQLAANTNLISVNFAMAGDKVADAQLELLKPVTEQVAWLNLAGTKVTDGGLAQIAGLKNLKRLHLEKTGVGDDGLVHLKGLGELQYLNLYATKVGDKGLAHLKGLKKLEKVFLWQTTVTDAGAAELGKALPTLNINRGVDLTTIKPPDPPKTEPAVKAVNTKCPVLGKDVVADATFTYKGQVIGFCCNNCKGKFEAEPAKYIAKVDGFKEPAKPEVKPVAAGKPINEKCPVQPAKDINPEATITYKGQVIAFCCKNCPKKFEAEPAKYIANLKNFKDPEKKEEPKKDAPKQAAKAINKKCPVQPAEDVDPKVTVEYKGQAIGFCCKDCVKDFNKDPAKYIKNVKEFKEPKKEEPKKEEPKKEEPKKEEPKKEEAKKAINTVCPVKDKAVNPEVTFTYKEQVISFCCKNCCAAFSKEPEKYIAKVKEFKNPEKK